MVVWIQSTYPPPNTNQIFQKMSPTLAVQSLERLQVPDSFSFAKTKPQHSRGSKDYYTLTSSASFDSLLFHPVPSPSLCLEEMLELWPSSPQPLNLSQQHQHGKHICFRHTKKADSIDTLVDFGHWISQQSHSRAQSLLPPTPAALRQDLPNLKSDSVECPLSSVAQDLAHHIEQQDDTVLHRTTNYNHLEKLCIDLQHSSFTSEPYRGQKARTITPVPSLTYSQYSTTSSIAADGSCPEARISNYSNSLKSVSASRDPNMNHQTFEHLQQETNHIHPNQRLSFYQRNSCEQSADNAIQSTTRAPVHSGHYNPVLNPSFDRTRVQARPPLIQAPCGENEVSYIDWDEDDEDGGHRSESRLARMKKSITDLRAAERFIADAASRRNTGHRAVQSGHEESPSVVSAKIPRPAYSRVHTDTSFLSLQHKWRQQSDRQRYSRSVSATDNILKSSNTSEDQPTSSYAISLSLPSKFGSIRALYQTKSRKQFNPTYISTPRMNKQQEEQPPQSFPVQSQGQTAPPPDLPSTKLSATDSTPEDRSNKRHRRGRTISSGLEGFPQLPTMTMRDSAEQSHEIPRRPSSPIPVSTATALPIKRNRFSTFTSFSTSKAKDVATGPEKENPRSHKRPKLGNGAVTRWVKRVFSRRRRECKGKGKCKTPSTVTHRI